MYQTRNTIETYCGMQFYRIDNDVNGNGRYVVHFLDIASNYAVALSIAKHFGGQKYRAKWFGGGIVFTTSSPQDLATNITVAIK